MASDEQKKAASELMKSAVILAQNELFGMIDQAKEIPGTDPRLLAVAKTQIELGFLAFREGIAKIGD